MSSWIKLRFMPCWSWRYCPFKSKTATVLVWEGVARMHPVHVHVRFVDPWGHAAWRHNPLAVHLNGTFFGKYIVQTLATYLYTNHRMAGYLTVRPKISPVSDLYAHRLRPMLWHFLISNCSQNCWIDWNSAMLCFKWLFLHRGMNVIPICAASLSHHTLCKGKFGLVPITMYTYMYKYTGWQKIIAKNRFTAQILKPIYDQKPETFFVGRTNSFASMWKN